MRKPRRRLRCTERLPKMYMYALSTLLDKSNIGLRKMHERGPPQSACPNACRQSGPESKEKTSFFSGNDGGLGRDIRHAIHWFLHKFNVDLVDTLRLGAFKAAHRLCRATAPLLNHLPNACILSLAAAAVGIPSPFRNEDSIMDGLCQELPARLRIPCLCRRCSFKADSMADLAAKKVDWWTQNEDNLPHWAGAVKMVLLVQRSSAAIK